MCLLRDRVWFVLTFPTSLINTITVFKFKSWKDNKSSHPLDWFLSQLNVQIIVNSPHLICSDIFLDSNPFCQSLFSHKHREHFPQWETCTVCVMGQTCAFPPSWSVCCGTYSAVLLSKWRNGSQVLQKINSQVVEYEAVVYIFVVGIHKMQVSTM